MRSGNPRPPRVTVFFPQSFALAIVTVTLLASVPARADEKQALTPCTVSGRVVNAETGAGIAGAEVRVFGAKQGVRTDASGAYTLEDLPLDRAHRLWATAAGMRHPAEAQWIVPTPGGVIENVELPLVPVPPLTIEVKSKGRAISGATVLLGANVPGLEPQVDSGTIGPSNARTTDAKGLVTFDRLDLEHVDSLVVVVQSPEHETRVRSVRWDGLSPRRVTVPIVPAPKRTCVITSNDPAISVAGGTLLVCDELRNFPRGTDGRYAPTPYAPDARAIPIDGNGRAVFPAKKWPRFALVESPQIGVRLVELGKLKGSREREIRVTAGPRWEGTIVDDRGNPIPGVHVSIADSSSGGGDGFVGPSTTVGPLYSAVTDRAGKVSLPRLEAADRWRECAVTLRKAGWEVASAKESFLRRSPRTLTMVRALPERRIPIRFTIGESDAVPTVVRFRAVRLYGERASATRKLEKLRGKVARSSPGKRPTVRELERQLRGFERASAVTVHTVGAGSWPESAVERYLARSTNRGADLLEGLDGSRTMLWGRVPAHLLAPDAPEVTDPIVIPFELGD